MRCSLSYDDRAPGIELAIEQYIRTANVRYNGHPQFHSAQEFDVVCRKILTLVDHIVHDQLTIEAV
jgi:hypothetical protein